MRYQLKIPYRNSITHVLLEPLDFIARLAALVPKPRLNLIRYHGVFAPNSPRRGEVMPGKRGRCVGAQSTAEPKTDVERRSAMTCAQRLRREFKIDIETCDVCGGTVKVVASIEDPLVIRKILAHQGEVEPRSGVLWLPEPRPLPLLWN